MFALEICLVGGGMERKLVAVIFIPDSDIEPV
jgi:hypothetical protein